MFRVARQEQLCTNQAPKIFGHILVSAFIGFVSWKAVEKLLYNDPIRPKLADIMLRWFSSSPPKLLQDPEKRYEVKLIEREEVSHDTRRFRFGLPTKDHVLGLPVGQHVSLIATIDDSEVIRSYTPVSSDDNKGYVEFVIKVYFKNVHPKFPDGGKMSQHLESLKIGDSITIRGPKGRLQYQGKGNLLIQQDAKKPAQKRQVKRLSMIAGGTGIAPMLQVIRDILSKSDSDKTKIALLFANQSEKDILLRDELEQFAAKYPEQLKLWYTIDRADEGWKYSTGFVNKDMIKEHLYESDNDTHILLCGPPPMIKFVNSQLDELNWPMEHRFKY